MAHRSAIREEGYLSGIMGMQSDKIKSLYAIKANTKRQAWEFGAGSDMEKQLISSGRVIAHEDGSYEVFTKEATEGKGQMAKTGDYFKVDEEGFPSPCEKDWFEENHTHIEGDWYIQTAKPLKIWRKDDPETEEIRYLLEIGALTIHSEDPVKYYSAYLWGTMETAPDDAVIVFYAVNRDEDGNIGSVTFNFVDADYFKDHYKIIDSPE